MGIITLNNEKKGFITIKNHSEIKAKASVHAD